MTTQRRGALAGLAAYLLWGLFPLYFAALRIAGPWEVLGHRIVWSLVICVGVLVVLRDLTWLSSVLRRPRLLLGLAVAAAVIAVNWGVYIAAVQSGHTSDAALGYFLNPLITVALGVVVLRERLRVMQWAAIGVGAVAAIYLTVVGGQVPIIALTLACTFATYGLIKKRVGASLRPVPGLAVEAAILLPLAIWLLLGPGTPSTLAGHGGWHTTLLLLTGPATVIPLLLFAEAARTVPLVTIGLLQFVTPVMQLLCGLWLGEVISPARWLGFVLVWVALVILAIDMIRSRRPRPQPTP